MLLSWPDYVMKTILCLQNCSRASLLSCNGWFWELFERSLRTNFALNTLKYKSLKGGATELKKNKSSLILMMGGVPSRELSR